MMRCGRCRWTGIGDKRGDYVLQWQLKGIDTFHPLERIRVRPARLGRKTPTYFLARLKQFGTRVDLNRSLIEYNGPFACTYCLEANVDSIRGFAIDETSWTGEDVFIPWGKSGSIIVTDRVKELWALRWPETRKRRRMMGFGRWD